MYNPPCQFHATYSEGQREAASHSRSERFYTTAWTRSCSFSLSGNTSIFRCMDFSLGYQTGRKYDLKSHLLTTISYCKIQNEFFSCKQNHHRSSLRWTPVPSQEKEWRPKYRSAPIYSNTQMWWSTEGWWETTNQKALIEFNSVEIKRRRWEYDDTTDFTLSQNEHTTRRLRSVEPCGLLFLSRRNLRQELNTPLFIGTFNVPETS